MGCGASKQSNLSELVDLTKMNHNEKMMYYTHLNCYYYDQPVHMNADTKA